MRFLLAFFIAIACWGQITGISVTAPANSTTIGQNTAYLLTCSVTFSSNPNLYSVEYLVDGERQGIVKASNPSTCPSLPWNTYYLGNNSQHLFLAIARDVKGNCLAVSDGSCGTPGPGANTVSVENCLPQQASACSSTPSAANFGDISVSLGDMVHWNGLGITNFLTATIGFTSAGDTPAIGNTCKGLSGSNNPACTLTVTGGANHVLHAWVIAYGTVTITIASPWQCDALASVTGGKAVNCFLMTPSGGSTAVTAATTGASSSKILVEEFSGVTGQNVAYSTQNGCLSCGAPYTNPFDVANHDLLISSVDNGLTNIDSTTVPLTFSLAPNTDGGDGVAYAVGTGGYFGLLGELATATGPNAANAFNDQVLHYIPYPTIDAVGLPPSEATPIVPSNAGPNLWAIDSRRYLNGTHAFMHLVTSSEGVLCPTCTKQGWRTYGQFEKQITITNPVVPSQLRMQYKDVTICVAPSTLCPSSQTNTGTVVYTDGSTAPATLSTCVMLYSGYATLTKVGSGAGNTCTWAALTTGSTPATITDSNGLQATTWVYSVAANATACLGDDGATYQAYSTHCKAWKALFFSGMQLIPSGDPLFDSNYPQSKAIGDLTNSGFAAAELGIPVPGWTQTQSSWESQSDTFVNTYCSLYSMYGIKFNFVLDNWLGGGQGTTTSFATNNNAANANGANAAQSTWTVPPLQSLMQKFGAQTGCALYDAIKDEVTSQWHYLPDVGLVAPGIVIGTSGPTVSGAVTYNFTGPMDCTSDPCVATMAGWQSSGMTVTGSFVISGSGTSLDFNSTTGVYPVAGSPNTLAPTCINPGCDPHLPTYGTSTQFSFPRPTGATGKYCVSAGFAAGCTATPNLAIQQFAVFGIDKNGVVAGTGGAPYGYVPGDVFKKVLTWSTAGNVPISAAPPAISNFAIPNLCDPSISNYCEQYVDNGGGYLPTRGAPAALTQDSQITDYGMRYFLALTMGRAWNIKGEGYANDFTYQGWPGQAVTCLGSTLTFSSPHNIPNTIPGITRGRACGGTQVYVEASPTATTLTVSLAATTISATSNKDGTILFDDGNSYNVHLCNIPGGGCSGVGINSIQDGNCFTDGLVRELGRTFTVTSVTGGTGWSGTTFILGGENVISAGTCGNGNMVWRQMANFSSSSGTAYMIPDNLFTWGRNWPVGYTQGPVAAAISMSYPLLLGASLTRDYSEAYPRQHWSTDNSQGRAWTSHDVDILSATFNGGCADYCLINGGINPHYENGLGLLDMWDDVSLNNFFTSLLPRWLFQPRLPSPDYGPQIETTARQDASGNRVLWLQAFHEHSVSVVADLTNYFLSGKTIVKYVYRPWPDRGIDVSTITANTTSDTTANCFDCSIAYVFDAQGAGILNQPSVSMRLADVTNATGVLAQFCYTPYCFSQQTSTLPQIKDCGSAFPCTIPGDLHLGPIMMRPIYYDTNGKALTAGDYLTLR